MRVFDPELEELRGLCSVRGRRQVPCGAAPKRRLRRKRCPLMPRGSPPRTWWPGAERARRQPAPAARILDWPRRRALFVLWGRDRDGGRARRRDGGPRKSLRVEQRAVRRCGRAEDAWDLTGGRRAAGSSWLHGVVGADPERESLILIFLSWASESSGKSGRARAEVLSLDF